MYFSSRRTPTPPSFTMSQRYTPRGPEACGSRLDWFFCRCIPLRIMHWVRPGGDRGDKLAKYKGRPRLKHREVSHSHRLPHSLLFFLLTFDKYLQHGIDVCSSTEAGFTACPVPCLITPCFSSCFPSSAGWYEHRGQMGAVRHGKHEQGIFLQIAGCLLRSGRKFY